ncbi:MAG TPA: DUF1203 domain-containing protein [Actinomycetales bacterium]|nr:DUF1203 domain-containing protein [Actinomycetales bacterium]
MTTMPADLKVHPIDAAELDDVRQQGVDRWGNRPEDFVSDGGDQLRCCLRLSQPGETLWVIAHAPLTAQRPWREVGPVFVHAAACGGYEPAQGLPGFIGATPRVLRSYTADGAMFYAGNRVTEPGDDLDAILKELLAEPAIAEVHVRNVEAQCFIARVTH